MSRRSPIYTSGSLLSAHMDSLENILWSAVRTLEENSSLSLKISNRMNKHKLIAASKFYNEKAKSAQNQANILRDMIVRNPLLLEKNQIKEVIC